MFMRSGRKLDKTLTSLFKFDKNTSATLDRLVGEIHENKELCSYQFLNHPGSDDMLAGVVKLVRSNDKRYSTVYSIIVFRRLVSINLVWKSFTYAYSNLDLLQVDSNVEKNSKSGTTNTSSRARAPLVALGL